MSDPRNIQRTALPIPDQPHVGLTTYDELDRLISPQERLRVAMALQ